jgi:hypothetical protein
MTRIFISYRRTDSATIAGRIYDRLVDEFGEDNVFKDTYGITPGDDFRGVIREQVALCDVVLVIIGTIWLNITEADNPALRRLDNPADWVRIEVETALQRNSARVIPVLVNGASMPREVDLPPVLDQLAFRNGISVREDPDFRPDMNRLIDAIRRVSRQPSSDVDVSQMPTAAQTGGHDNTQINVTGMFGGTVIGKQANYGTPLPASPRPQDMPQPEASPPKRKWLRPVVGALVVILTLLFAFLALFPEQSRIDWFRSLGLLAAVPTNTAAPTIAPSETASVTLAPSNTPVPATNASAPITAPTSTPVPPPSTEIVTVIPQATPVTTSGLTIGSQASVRSSNEAGTYLNIHVGFTRNDNVIQQVPVGTVVTIVDGPVASEDRIWWKVRTPDGVEGWAIEASSIRQTLVPVERTATLRLFLETDTLTLLVAAGNSLNVSGLQFSIVDSQGSTRTLNLTDGFDILQLTGGVAESGACFVYRLTGSNQPLQSACNQPNRVYRRDVPRADVFWYDFTANRQRDVAVLRDGTTVTVCSAAATECAISYH